MDVLYILMVVFYKTHFRLVFAFRMRLVGYVVPDSVPVLSLSNHSVPLEYRFPLQLNGT